MISSSEITSEDPRYHEFEVYWNDYIGEQTDLATANQHLETVFHNLFNSQTMPGLGDALEYRAEQDRANQNIIYTYNDQFANDGDGGWSFVYHNSSTGEAFKISWDAQGETAWMDSMIVDDSDISNTAFASALQDGDSGVRIERTVFSRSMSTADEGNRDIYVRRSTEIDRKPLENLTEEELNDTFNVFTYRENRYSPWTPSMGSYYHTPSLGISTSIYEAGILTLFQDILNENLPNGVQSPNSPEMPEP